MCIRDRFPSPIVPESAAVKALKWLTSPTSLSLEYFPVRSANACGRYLKGRKPEKIKKKMPEPTRNITNHGPHANVANCSAR